ncbi:MAG TPA: SRPBCC domain-containing protein, partial [Actinomycetes bacterium]|nr:SRPBCC domain-containing protein [Actinomycetes bacterium]
ITAGVASIKGTYEGEVALADQQPPSTFVLRASGAGAPGTVQADVTVTLAPDGSGGAGTLLHYDADAVVGGMVGGVGQRMLTGVAKKTAGEFFKAVDDVLTGAAPAVAPAAAEPAVVGAPAAVGEAGPKVFAAPAKPAGALAGGAPWWQLLAAFGFGAFWGLAGVVIGSRIARRR